MHVSVSPANPIRYPSDPPLPGPHGQHYNLPGPIGPHQYRLMRVLWTSRGDCLSAGASSGIDHLALLVRVGLLTRTEDAPLDQAWALSGRG